MSRSAAQRRVRAVHKLPERNVKCTGDSGKDVETGAPTPALDTGDVGPMEFGSFGQPLLREPPLPRSLAEGPSDVHETRSCENAALPTIDYRL